MQLLGVRYGKIIMNREIILHNQYSPYHYEFLKQHNQIHKQNQNNTHHQILGVGSGK